MRVTQNMLDRNLIFSISYNMERLSKLNEQLSTGKRLNTVSDDVPAARQVMFLQRENAKIDACLQNLNMVESMLAVSTSTLQSVSETVSRVKELAIQAATGTYTPANRRAMAEGVNGLLESLVSMANVEQNGAYVFSGQSTRTAPFEVTRNIDGDIDSVVYVGEMVSTEAVVAPGVTAEANLVGKDIFQRQGDLFETLIELRDAMRADDMDEINRLIGSLETSHEDIRQSLGQLGERHAQLQLLRTVTENLRGFNEQVISDRQDADISRLSIEYNSHIALLQIVMKLAASSANLSIANFL